MQKNLIWDGINKHVHIKLIYCMFWYLNFLASMIFNKTSFCSKARFVGPVSFLFNTEDNRNATQQAVKDFEN